jgi:hypothetical protein
MPRQFAAIALCLLAQGAAAQCAGTAANASTAITHPAAGTAAAPAQPPARAELIKTAAAGTRDDAPTVAREPARSAGDGQDHPRRGGTAMLLAALALMSGIALRRYGAPDA